MIKKITMHIKLEHELNDEEQQIYEVFELTNSRRKLVSTLKEFFINEFYEYEFIYEHDGVTITKLVFRFLSLPGTETTGEKTQHCNLAEGS